MNRLSGLGLYRMNKPANKTLTAWTLHRRDEQTSGFIATKHLQLDVGHGRVQLQQQLLQLVEGQGAILVLVQVLELLPEMGLYATRTIHQNGVLITQVEIFRRALSRTATESNNLALEAPGKHFMVSLSGLA